LGRRDGYGIVPFTIYILKVVTGTHCTVYSRDFSKFFSGRIEHATTVSKARARVTIFFIFDVVLLKYPVGIITQSIFSVYSELVSEES
jgi:hypothetical protein